MLKRASLLAAAAAAIGIGSYFVRAEDKPATPAPAASTEAPKPDTEGFVEMFNGKDLSGWEGFPGYWSVKDGAILGSETKEKSKHTFLVYTANENIANFEMHYKFKFSTPTGNSGMQFRSKIYDAKGFGVGGYQADCDAPVGFGGIIYDEHGVAGGRGIMSGRGQKVTWDENNKRHDEPLADSDAELKKLIHVDDWNDCVLIADGNHITYKINGHVTTDLTDNSPKALKEGVIALQIHGGFTMDIWFKDLKIKILK